MPPPGSSAPGLVRGEPRPRAGLQQPRLLSSRKHHHPPPPPNAYIKHQPTTLPPPPTQFKTTPPQVIYLSGPAAPGLQTKLKQVFHDLGVDVKRHDVNGGVDAGAMDDAFYVRAAKGGKLSEAEIAKACAVLEGIVKAQAAASRAGVRPKFQTQTIAPDPAKREVLYAIMGESC